MLSRLPFHHAFSLWQTHTHSLSLSLCLLLLITLTSFDLPTLSCHPSCCKPYFTPSLSLSFQASHLPHPFKSLSISMLLSFSLSSHMPPPLLTWQTSPHPLLSSSSPPLILSFPINLSLLFLSHFFFYHPPTPPFFYHPILQLPLLFLTLSHFSPHSPL